MAHEPFQEHWARNLSAETWTIAHSTVSKGRPYRAWSFLVDALSHDSYFLRQRSKILEAIEKDEAVAERHRIAGNQHFQSKCFDQATTEYSKGVLFAATHAGSSLALSLANRSTALLHLKQYLQALRDAEAALSHGHPSPEKIQDRATRCRAHLASSRESGAKKSRSLAVDNSRAYEIRDGEGARGRGLYATRAVAAGTIIWSEKPISHVACVQTACRCDACKQETYCCPDHAALGNGHLLQGMCAVAGLLSPQAHFAARLVAQGSDGAINHLVDHDYSEGSDSLPVAFLAECALAAAAADAMTGVPAEKVYSALLRIRCNGVAIQGSRSGRVGLGLYRDISMLNHDCGGGNVMLSFDGTRAIVSASRDIAAGDELLLCYGPQQGRHSREQRAIMLKEQYAFECHCESCSRDAAADSLRLLCPNVGPVTPGNKPPWIHKCINSAIRLAGCEARPIDDYQNSCVVCGQYPDKEVIARALAMANADWASGESSLEAGNVPRAMKNFYACLHARAQVLHSTNKGIGEVCDRLAQCYAILGDYHTAAGWCISSTEVCEALYGSNSIEYAQELFKLAQLHFNAMDRVQGQAAVSLAIQHLLPFKASQNARDMLIELQEMKRYI